MPTMPDSATILRFKPSIDHNELITQMDAFILKNADILLGVRQERSLKFSLVDITTELGR